MKTFAILSNACAWLLLVTGVAAAVACPIAVPIYAKMQSTPVSWLYILALSAVGLAMAAGALLVLKRRPIGVWISLVPGLAWVLAGQTLAGIAYVAVVLLVLGLPVLVYKSLAGGKSVDPRVA